MSNRDSLNQMDKAYKLIVSAARSADYQFIADLLTLATQLQKLINNVVEVEQAEGRMTDGQWNV